MTASQSWARADADGVRLEIHAQPGAKRSEVVGIHDGKLKLRLAARAVEGAANDELIRFIAQTLGIPRSAITLVRGEKSRAKSVFCAGISEEHAIGALAPGVPC